VFLPEGQFPVSLRSLSAHVHTTKVEHAGFLGADSRAVLKAAAFTLRTVGRDDRGILELAGVDCDERALVAAE
jgi:hypothetical protein